MSIPNGEYLTAAGSYVNISGAHGGISEVVFDWCEETNACCDCTVDPYPDWNGNAWILRWDCKECDGGCAELFPAVEHSEPSE